MSAIYVGYINPCWNKKPRTENRGILAGIFARSMFVKL
jgi:hypothetical protein